jgi:hypothetical protein
MKNAGLGNLACKAGGKFAFECQQSRLHFRRRLQTPPTIRNDSIPAFADG